MFACGLSVTALNSATSLPHLFTQQDQHPARGRALAAIPCGLYAGVSGAAARLDGGQGRGGHSLSIGAGSVKQARLFARPSSPRGVSGVRWALAAELTYATMHGRTLTARAFADTARLAASRSGLPVDARLKGYVNWLWPRHRANVQSGAHARMFAAVQGTRGRASGVCGSRPAEIGIGRRCGAGATGRVCGKWRRGSGARWARSRRPATGKRDGRHRSGRGISGPSSGRAGCAWAGRGAGRACGRA